MIELRSSLTKQVAALSVGSTNNLQVLYAIDTNNQGTYKGIAF